MDVPSILYLIVLIILSGIFSSLEIAFFTLSEAKIDVLIKEKKLMAETVKKLKDNPEKLLTTILIGNNIVNIMAASIATKLALGLFGSSGVAIATFIMTVIILMFGEILPKAFATANAQSIALIMAFPLLWFQILLLPIIKVFEKITKFVMKYLKVGKKKRISDEELRAMARISAREGGIEKNEHKLIQNALRFNDIEVYQIMTPRVKMIALDQESLVADSLPIIRSHSYSRIPIYKENDDNITGIFYVRDILSLSEADFKNKRLKDMSLKPLFTAESRKIDSLFKEFQQSRTHIAVVLDEHGGTAGIVTLEDIIEELVGEIDDETDEKKRLVRKINKDTVLAWGEAEVKEIADAFDIEDIPDEQLNLSLNGFLCELFENIPKEGDALKKYNLSFVIEEATEKMIKKVRIHRDEEVLE